MPEFPALLPSNPESDPQPSSSTDVLEACAEAVVEQSVGKKVFRWMEPFGNEKDSLC